MKNSLFGLNFLSRFLFGLITAEAFRFYVTNTDSVQMATINSVSFDQLKPNEAYGKIRVAYFDFTTLAAGNADGDSYNLNKIPKGARVLGIKTVNAALGAGVVAKIGITGALTKYGSAIDMAAAGEDFFCTTVATYGLETTAEETLIMTLTGAAPNAAANVKGEIRYVID